MQPVCKRLTQLLSLVTPPAKNRIIAIDGRCASGKTTLAIRLAAITGAGVVHMDDFFLPEEMRTPERISLPGGNIHHERFAQEVLPYLRSGEGFAYRIFECTQMDYGGVRKVAPSPLRIIEGAYSHHPALGDYADVRVFVDIDASNQIERIKQRNGNEAVVIFTEKWIPMEEAYIRMYRIDANAELVLPLF